VFLFEGEALIGSGRLHPVPGPPGEAAEWAELKRVGVRADQPRLVHFWSSLGYALAGDVQLHTVNPLTPPPTTMRKRF
jgi:hypothetical protein